MLFKQFKILNIRKLTFVCFGERVYKDLKSGLGISNNIDFNPMRYNYNGYNLKIYKVIHFSYRYKNNTKEKLSDQLKYIDSNLS